MKKLSTPNLKKERGQSLVILAFSFVGLIALMGLAIDVGLVYIERTDLKRAIDASVLSGVTELSNEQEAGDRALDYLTLNGYDMENSEVWFKGCIKAPGSNVVQNEEDYVEYRPYLGAGDPAQTFWIDTLSYQSLGAGACGDVDNDPATAPLLGDANKLSITGTVTVDMNFFRLLGRGEVPVTDHAIAQNVDNLDVVIVLDRSGSMEFDPVCYGCWTRLAGLTPDDNNTPPYSDYYNYPANGRIYPVGGTDQFSHAGIQNACTLPGDPGYDPAQTVYANGSFRYLIMEAELYSLNPSPVAPGLQAAAKAYWALQRGEGNYGRGDGTPNYGTTNAPWLISQGTSVDDIEAIVGVTPADDDSLGSQRLGAHMAVHPSLTEYDGVPYGKLYTLSEAQNFQSPWLEYDFRLDGDPAAGWGAEPTGYIWARVHSGRGLNYDVGNIDPQYEGVGAENIVYWGLVKATAPNITITNGILPGEAGVDTLQAVTQAPNVNRAAISSYSNNWHWLRIGSFPIETDTDYRFYFIAGSAGYSIDRIVITDNYFNNGHNGNGSTLGDARFEDATMGSAGGVASRAACDICNEIYGEDITNPADCTFFGLTEAVNNANHPIYGEWESPLRSTKEAIKFFGKSLDPERDQMGFVFYSASGIGKSQLACLQSAKINSTNCVGATGSFSFTTILRDVEAVRASGGTPTAAGMREGLEVLGIGSGIDISCTPGDDNSSCARPGAQKVLILMTDGVPNSTNYSNIDGCSSSTSPEWPSNNNASHRCPLYLAEQAANNGVIVYTIGIGFGVNRDWLAEIADRGNGLTFASFGEGNTRQILNEILQNIYVRLVE